MTERFSYHSLLRGHWNEILDEVNSARYCDISKLRIVVDNFVVRRISSAYEVKATFVHLIKTFHD